MSEISTLLNSYIEQALLNTGLNNNINNTTPAKQAVLTQQINTQYTKDTFVSLLKEKIKTNKKGLIAGVITGMGIAAGIIYGVKTGKLQGLIANIKGDKVQLAGEETIKDTTNISEREINGIIEEVANITEESESVSNEATNKLNEVLNLIAEGEKDGFQEVKDESGNIIRRFVNAADDINPKSNKVMEELDASGAVKRSTEFVSSNILDNIIIKEYIDETGKYDEYYRFDAIYRPLFVSKGVEELADGSKKIDKHFHFSDYGRLQNYYENRVQFYDGNVIADKHIGFVGKRYALPSHYTVRNHKYLADGSSSEITDSFDFGVLEDKIVDVFHKRDINGIHKLSEHYYKEDGKWQKIIRE